MRAALVGACSGRSAPAVAAVGAMAVVASELVHPAFAVAPTWRASVGTAATLFALAGACLFKSRFGHSRQVRDLALLGAALSLGLTELYAYALPAVLDLGTHRALIASGFWGDVVVAALFAAAALTPADRLVGANGHTCTAAVGLSVVGVAAAGIGGFFLRDELPARAAVSGGIHAIPQRPIAFGLTVLAVCVFATAAIALARSRRGGPSAVGSILSATVILLAAARLGYLVLPASPSDLLTPSIGLRLLASMLLFGAVASQEVRARALAAQAAAKDERRRIARDLHDALAQDLAFIAAQGSRLTGQDQAVTLAARRALATCRHTIAELSTHAGAGTREALDAVARDLRDRFEVAIGVDAQLDDELTVAEQEHIARIAREAIINACRHGAARHVSVSLQQTSAGIHLRVIDDGSGIRSRRGGGPREGFGLRIMRERASELGGRMQVRERAQGGTELEVLVP